MRVVLTGGTGFLGFHLSSMLLSRGDEVVAVDNMLTGSKANVESLSDLFGGAFEFMHHDVSLPFDVRGDVDAVLHFASPASPPDYMEHTLATLRVGSNGTFNALDLAQTKGARFMVASTSEVYGEPLVHPQPESYWGNVNPNGPRSVYDEAKRFAEAVTFAYRRTLGAPASIVRFFNTYGPRMRPEDGRVVSNFIVQALVGKPLTVYGDGTQTRSFGYVADIVAGTVALLDSELAGPVNLGNPNEFTMLELAELVLELTGSKSVLEFMPLPEDDPSQRQPDITIAREQLGWEPTTSLRDGLVPTIDYFRQIVSS